MKTVIGKQYCVTCDSACDIVDTATGNTIHTHHAGEAQSYFTAIGLEVEASDDTAVVTEVFKSAPAGNGGGGYIESNLNVGHGAADAVAAVCTLTLGDLATGGTLADSNGQSVELEAPHKYATGTVSIADATAAGTLAIGEWSKAWEADPGARATGWLQLADGLGTFMVNGGIVSNPDDYTDVEAWNGILESCGVFCTDESIETGSPKINIAAIEYGEAGDSITLEPAEERFHVSGPTLTGGANGRTAVDVFNDILADGDSPVDVTLDTDKQGLGFTAKEYGVNDEIAITGDLFSDAMGMSGGHGDYSVAELVTAIAGEFEDITAASGETEGTITLTANTAGKAANAITYTATGCFGGETVKQGSTTRGKNAVEQTAFKIYLNGAELDVEPAPVPEPLEDDTAMRNGGVYTVAAEGTELNFSAVTLGDYGAASIWLDYNDTTQVDWPAWSWATDDGLQPECEYFKRYKLAVENDGVKTRARIADSYVTHAEYVYTALTQESQEDESLELYIVKAETNKGYGSSYTAYRVFGNGEFNLGPKIAQNLLDEDFTPEDTPTGYPYSFGALTFETKRSVDLHAVDLNVKGAASFEATGTLILQAWNGESWETCGIAELTGLAVEYRHARLSVTNHVTAHKWRLLGGSTLPSNFIGLKGKTILFEE